MTPGVQFTERERQVWLTFLEASQLLDRQIEQRLRAVTGLTHPQFEILLNLSKAPCARLRMGELAERMITTKSGLSYQITQLEKAGLVCAPPARATTGAESTPRSPRPAGWPSTPPARASRRWPASTCSTRCPPRQLSDLHDSLTLIRDRLRRGLRGCCELLRRVAAARLLRAAVRRVSCPP